ncbi:hydroxyneurosporene-O-methyltransferase [Chitinophaga niastensis]|uniref:Hydroxyneurosporene-O-methyltransferase n=1 Tax=Chitinophaga niastensis TaxID=536980 RepID=A0A2P8HH60_CHINA|nr:methyltransferase [Chitinophaga niastensis]PSL45563.1 hydroxyneurosporene-O-methyltransferase [Chitinophaga niastensis]
MDNTNPSTSAVASRQQSERILKYITNHWLSCCVYVSARLNIADILSDGPKTIDELAEITATHRPSLYRLLRTLASDGIFEESAPGTFSITQAATALRGNVQGSLKAFVLAELGDFYNPWGQLLYSVQTGKIAFDHYHGMNLWEYYKTHPEEGLNFMKAMTDLTQVMNQAVAEKYDFSTFKTLIDIGGGNGELMFSVLKATPGLNGIVFDELYVVEQTAARIKAIPDIAGRCSVAAGNFFEQVPPGADAYMMKYILHDWHDEDALKILRACSNAMKTGSKILAIDAVIPQGNLPHGGKLMDVNMLVVTGGYERTKEEFSSLYEQAGLRFLRVVDIGLTELSIVEGEKI